MLDSMRQSNWYTNTVPTEVPTASIADRWEQDRAVGERLEGRESRESGMGVPLPPRPAGEGREDAEEEERKEEVRGREDEVWEERRGRRERPGAHRKDDGRFNAEVCVGGE